MPQPLPSAVAIASVRPPEAALSNVSVTFGPKSTGQLKIPGCAAGSPFTSATIRFTLRGAVTVGTDEGRPLTFLYAIATARTPAGTQSKPDRRRSQMAWPSTRSAVPPPTARATSIRTARYEITRATGANA